VLRFRHIYELASPERHWVEIAINGGSWQKLGSRGSGTGWYNAFAHHWEGNSGPPGVWNEVSHPITGAAGNHVQIRFFLDGKTSFPSGAGIGIDELRVECDACTLWPYGGTREDLDLLSSTGNQPPNATSLETITGGELLNLVIHSPGQTLVGEPWVLLLTEFEYGSGATVPQPVPGLFGTPATVTFAIPGLVLPGSGARLTFLWPPAATGTAVLAQGVALTARGRVNPFFASTEAHIIHHP
jgi:hypothetical protein